MDIIKQCFDEHALTFTGQLQTVGFSRSEAHEFLSVAASSVLQSSNPLAVRQAIVDLISDHPAMILNSINLSSFARQLGISAQRARSGLDAISPVLSTILRRKKDSIVDTVIALAWNEQGKMTDAARQFFH